MPAEPSDSQPESNASAPPTTAPFGSWRSPISGQALVKGQSRISQLCRDGDDLYWVEARPEQNGRHAVLRYGSDGTTEEIVSPPFDVRTTVHEYGGGSMLASKGVVYFSNFSDQRLWRVVPGQAPQALTAAEKVRFADFIHDEAHNRLIAVCEDHRKPGAEPATRLVGVSLENGAVTTLAEGADFYATPRLNSDGTRLAWLEWQHPNMPWDGTELRVADVDSSGSLRDRRSVAGGNDESVFQPTWAPDGRLFFVSDRTNWWNLYCLDHGQVTPVLRMEAEFGVPQWEFGMRTFDFDASGRILARYTQGGRWFLIRIDPHDSTSEPIALDAWNIIDLCASENHFDALVSSPQASPLLIRRPYFGSEAESIRCSSSTVADPGYTSVPEAVEFPTTSGETAHAWYYAPRNRDYVGPADERPPLIVIIHGGPTSATRAELRLGIQYWTSRGFGVCDVNYGGSTGYGREYRNRLRDRWGIVDVDDAANAALYLAEQGKVDRDRLVIRGGSAGGYTTLACLAFKDVFRCGCSHYGVSDLALLARETHKFESRYLDRLVGPYPERQDLYRDRSPLHHLEGFDQPVLLLQGLEDKVVPPNQAETILEALTEKGVPVAYVPFEGEQHGFRKADTIIRAHEAEWYFFSRILEFPLPERIDPIEIRNLD